MSSSFCVLQEDIVSFALQQPLRNIPLPPYITAWNLSAIVFIADGSLSSSSRVHPFPGSRHHVSALVPALPLTGAGGFHGAAAQLVAATFADGGVFHHANAPPSGGKRKCTMQVEKRFISFSEPQKVDRNTKKNGWIIIK